MVRIWWKCRKNYCRFVYIFRVGYVRRIVGVILAHVLKLVDRTTWSISAIDVYRLHWATKFVLLEQSGATNCSLDIARKWSHFKPYDWSHVVVVAGVWWLESDCVGQKNLETIIFEVIAVFFLGRWNPYFLRFLAMSYAMGSFWMSSVCVFLCMPDAVFSFCRKCFPRFCGMVLLWFAGVVFRYVSVKWCYQCTIAWAVPQDMQKYIVWWLPVHLLGKLGHLLVTYCRNVCVRINTWNWPVATEGKQCWHFWNFMMTIMLGRQGRICPVFTRLLWGGWGGWVGSVLTFACICFRCWCYTKDVFRVGVGVGVVGGVAVRLGWFCYLYALMNMLIYLLYVLAFWFL